MDKPEPKGIKDGIPLLQMKDELDERAKHLAEEEQPAAH